MIGNEGRYISVLGSRLRVYEKIEEEEIAVCVEDVVKRSSRTMRHYDAEYNEMVMAMINGQAEEFLKSCYPPPLPLHLMLPLYPNKS